MLTEVYSEGFHGTSLSRANDILANGFRDDTGVPICFATPDNPDVAHEFGPIHAQSDGESFYGIIHAEFPATVTEPWPITLQVRIPAERASEIVVKEVTSFDVTSSGLYLPSDSQTPQVPQGWTSFPFTIKS